MTVSSARVADDSSTPPRRRGRPRVGRRSDIQRAAIELLLARGYSEMNVEDIAAELGVGRTTIFRYFETKAGLVWIDLDQRFLELRETLEATPQSAPVIDAIRQAVLASTGPDENERPLWRSRFALISSTPELEPERASIVAKFAETIAAFVRSRASVASHPVIPEALGYALAGVESSVTRAWANAPSGTSFDEMHDSALNAVLAPFAVVLAGDDAASAS